MDLQLIDKEYFKAKERESKFGVGLPYLTLGVDGVCWICLEAVNIMDLDAGDRIVFHFDRTEQEWYISRALTNSGYKVSGTNGHGLSFRSILLSQKIYESLKITPGTIKAPIVPVNPQPAGLLFEIFKVDFNNPYKVMNKGQRPFKARNT